MSRLKRWHMSNIAGFCSRGSGFSQMVSYPYRRPIGRYCLCPCTPHAQIAHGSRRHNNRAGCVDAWMPSERAGTERSRTIIVYHRTSAWHSNPLPCLTDWRVIYRVAASDTFRSIYHAVSDHFTAIARHPASFITHRYDVVQWCRFIKSVSSLSRSTKVDRMPRVRAQRILD